MARKGRARRFREARELKQGFEDGLFTEGERSLADLEQSDEEDQPTWRESDEDEPLPWDEDDPLQMDEGGRQAS